MAAVDAAAVPARGVDRVVDIERDRNKLTGRLTRSNAPWSAEITEMRRLKAGLEFVSPDAYPKELRRAHR